jgi:hypothetical protein
MPSSVKKATRVGKFGLSYHIFGLRYVIDVIAEVRVCCNCC